MEIKKLFKSGLEYCFIIVIGASLGYGVIWGHNIYSEPKVVLFGDYSQHFENTDKKIVMYGTDWCPVCTKARSYFDDEGIDYVELNPEKNQNAFELYSELDANGYPVIVIGNRRIFGLDTKEIKLAINEL